MKVQNKNGFIDLSQVYGSDLKAVEKDQAFSPQGPGSEGRSENISNENHASQIAEAKLQGDTRAAELKAQLDEEGPVKPKENGIIAILIG